MPKVEWGESPVVSLGGERDGAHVPAGWLGPPPLPEQAKSGRSHDSLAYSVLALFRIGVSESASFQSVKKVS